MLKRLKLVALVLPAGIGGYCYYNSVSLSQILSRSPWASYADQKPQSYQDQYNQQTKKPEQSPPFTMSGESLKKKIIETETKAIQMMKEETAVLKQESKQLIDQFLNSHSEQIEQAKQELKKVSGVTSEATQSFKKTVNEAKDKAEELKKIIESGVEDLTRIEKELENNVKSFSKTEQKVIAEEIEKLRKTYLEVREKLKKETALQLEQSKKNLTQGLNELTSTIKQVLIQEEKRIEEAYKESKEKIKSTVDFIFDEYNSKMEELRKKKSKKEE